MAEDLEAISNLPDGTLHFNLLDGTVRHTKTGELSLHVAGELSAWFLHRLGASDISTQDILGAELRAAFATDRIATNRKKIVYFDWNFESAIRTDEKTYSGRLIERHGWHSRLSPNKSLRSSPSRGD